MSCCPDPSTDQKAARADSVEALHVRSALYALLAHGFSYPDTDVIAYLRRHDGPERSSDGKLEEALSAVLAMARSAVAEERQRAYVAVFDPVAGPFPYESEFRNLQDFRKAQIMADLMGFYRAFGVEPNGDRPDHIACELDFMHLLTLKEAHALRAGEDDNAWVCRDAQEKFLREHLGAWSDALLEAMRARLGQVPDAFYTRLFDLLQCFMEQEKEELT